MVSRSKAEPHAAEEGLVGEIAREVVEQVAPHELVLFHAESTAYFRDPRRALKAARKRASAQPKDERFGFGSGELITLATPFVLAMVETALVTVGAHLMLTATERGAGSVRPLVRRVLRRPDPAGAGEPPADEDGTAEAEPCPAARAGADSAARTAAEPVAGPAPDAAAAAPGSTTPAAPGAPAAAPLGAVPDAADGPAPGVVDGSARPAVAAAAALPPAVIAAVRQAVYEQALRFGIDEDGSRLLADAVIGALTA
ncbi:hypothetical protein ACWFQ8_12675 [Streptomyces sp. NPDC055254]